MRAPKITTQIFIGMALGLLVGIVFPGFATKLGILGTIFLRLIKMVLAPLVFTTLVVGIAKTGDFKTVGRIGIKTLLYFQCATVMALGTGLILVNLLHPGSHFSPPTVAEPVVTAAAAKGGALLHLVEQLIPTSIFMAMANNELLQIVFFSLFVGVALASLGKVSEPAIKAFSLASEVTFKVTHYVMYFAPLAAFGALASVLGKYGVGVLTGYAYLAGSFISGLVIFIGVVLALICLVMRIPYFRLLKEVREPMLLAFSTASSEVAFPSLVAGLRRFGCPEKIIGFVLPLGYSFNLDGSMIYMTFATMFIAQVYGIHMDLASQITMMLILMVTSKGMAGVPRASLVVIAGTLTSFHIPVEGLALILGIDQILDMGRSATNVVGNAVATAVVCKLEGEEMVPQQIED